MLISGNRYILLNINVKTIVLLMTYISCSIQLKHYHPLLPAIVPTSRLGEPEDTALILNDPPLMNAPMSTLCTWPLYYGMS